MARCVILHSCGHTEIFRSYQRAEILRSIVEHEKTIRCRRCNYQRDLVAAVAKDKKRKQKRAEILVAASSRNQKTPRKVTSF